MYLQQYKHLLHVSSNYRCNEIIYHCTVEADIFQTLSCKTIDNAILNENTSVFRASIYFM